MQRLLFDQGLPGGAKVSRALGALGFDALTVGDGGAPPEGSSDETNCRWCATNDAVLVTHDRGKGNREILVMLDQHEVGALIVLRDLRSMPPHHLAKALLLGEGEIDQVIARGKRLRHYLRRSGHITSKKR